MAAPRELSRRLFVAIDLDEAIRDALGRVTDRLAVALADGATSSRHRVRWVARERLHVTVRFLGATPTAAVEPLRTALTPGFASPVFELRFDRLGTFPETGRPRVVWAGFSDDGAAVSLVRRELDARLEELGLAADRQRFRPHVTLGRFREPGRAADGRTVRDIAMEDMAVIGPMSVQRLTLYESHLSSRGPGYEVLRYTALDRDRTTRAP